MSFLSANLRKIHTKILFKISKIFTLPTISPNPLLSTVCALCSAKAAVLMTVVVSGDVYSDSHTLDRKYIRSIMSMKSPRTERERESFEERKGGRERES